MQYFVRPLILIVVIPLNGTVITSIDMNIQWEPFWKLYDSPADVLLFTVIGDKYKGTLLL